MFCVSQSVPTTSYIAWGSGSDVELDSSEESDPGDVDFVDDSEQADSVEEAASRQNANAEMDDRDNEQRAALVAQREKHELIVACVYAPLTFGLIIGIDYVF